MADKRKSGPDCPKAKSNNLLTEEVAGELLVFDVNNNRAHCLNASAAAIWRHCDGTRSIESLAGHLFPKLQAADSARLVAVGIERLRRRRLLEDSPSSQATVDLSKRQMLKKAAIIAAAAGVAAPLVSTVLAPTSAYAFSCIPSGLMCSASAQCCSGLCRSLQCA